jgi:hypothetical protein
MHSLFASQDYYGTAGSNNPLINDLDVELSDGANTYYPVVTTDTTGKYDRKNNLEVVLLFDPPANTSFTVKVTAHAVSITQPYALIISGEVGEFYYKNPDNNFVVVVLGVLLTVIFVACCVLCVAGYVSKRSAKEKKGSSVVEPEEFEEGNVEEGNGNGDNAPASDYYY